MPLERTSCIHRGNTFFGQFDTIGEGVERRIRMLYRGTEKEAPVGNGPPEAVAEGLLRDLVIAEAAAMKAAKSVRLRAARRSEPRPAFGGAITEAPKAAAAVPAGI